MRLYLRDIARVPLLSAEEEVVLAKGMELGRQIQAEPSLAVLSLREWTAARHRVQDPDRQAAVRPAVRRRGPAPRRATRSRDDAAMDLLVPTPDVGLGAARRPPRRRGARQLLGRRRVARAVYDERARRRVVHRPPRLDPLRDGPAPSPVGEVPAMRSSCAWTRDAVALPAIQRWIEAGHDADLLEAMGYRPGRRRAARRRPSSSSGKARAST